MICFTKMGDALLGFGKWFCYVIEETTLKDAQFVRALGVSRSLISDWKKRADPPDSEAAQRLMELVGYSDFEKFSFDSTNGIVKTLNIIKIKERVLAAEKEYKAEVVEVNRDRLLEALDWLAGHPLPQAQKLLVRVSKKTAIAVTRSMVERIAILEDG